MQELKSTSSMEMSEAPISAQTTYSYFVLSRCKKEQLLSYSKLAQILNSPQLQTYIGD